MGSEKRVNLKGINFSNIYLELKIVMRFIFPNKLKLGNSLTEPELHPEQPSFRIRRSQD